MNILNKTALAAVAVVLATFSSASAATISAMGVVSNEEIDTYYFSANSSGLVSIYVGETTAGDPPAPPGYSGYAYDFDSYIWLRNASDGSLVERDDDGGYGLESWIVRVLTAGDYYLEIGTHAGHHGHTDYTMRIRGDVSAVPVPAGLPLMASGLGLVGFLGWRRRRS